MTMMQKHQISVAHENEAGESNQREESRRPSFWESSNVGSRRKPNPVSGDMRKNDGDEEMVEEPVELLSQAGRMWQQRQRKRSSFSRDAGLPNDLVGGHRERKGSGVASKADYTSGRSLEKKLRQIERESQMRIKKIQQMMRKFHLDDEMGESLQF